MIMWTETLLVNRSVFDRAAKVVIKIGPNSGWKLEAWAKLKDVFPNQIWTMSQEIEATVQCFPSGLSAAGTSSVTDKQGKRGYVPRVQRVKRSPEKQIAAIVMKNANCDIIARSDLSHAVR